MSAPASIVELLDYIDPTALPQDVQDTLATIGPALSRGHTFTQIGEMHGRRKDWASGLVRQARAAILAQATEHLAEMTPALRRRVLAETEALTPPRYRSRLS